ncbi:MAG: hypothetical protein LIP09_10565 [Bacteroidales bacterium]|nr:hypothetical protein [Bacteroidales bacterium]
MIQVNTKEFRANQSMFFDKALEGERVMVRRKNHLFIILPIEEDDLTITPELEEKIAKARRAHAEGHCIKFDDKDKMNQWLDSL